MDEIDVRMMAVRIKALEERVKTLEEKVAVPADSRITTHSIAEYITRARGEDNPYKRRGRKAGDTVIRA